jgi:acyl-CoA dehydrogenase
MLPIYWDDSHHAFRESVRGWVKRHITPRAEQFEEDNPFDVGLYPLAGDAGILGASYPESVGGMGGDIFHGLIVSEELIRGGSVGTAVGLGSHSIALPPILHAGTEEQRQRFIPPVLRGEKIAALAITEPGAGSDVARITTRAVRDGDHYVINGSKTYITSGQRGDFITVAARTGGEGAGGITLFVVEKGMPGYSVGKPLKKMGWWASDTAELFFEDCRVPVENRIGDEGGGFPAMMANFASERLVLAATCVAMAKLALDASDLYVQEREAFGRPISGFQVTRHRLAEMATREAQARAFVSVVADEVNRDQIDPARVAMIKNAAVDACSFVCDGAVQLHGGMGYMRESLVERLYRDARLFPIGGGTTEIMREIISRFRVPGNPHN